MICYVRKIFYRSNKNKQKGNLKAKKRDMRGKPKLFKTEKFKSSCCIIEDHIICYMKHLKLIIFSRK